MIRRPFDRVLAFRARRAAVPPVRSIAIGGLLVIVALMAKAFLRVWLGEDIAYLTLFAILPVAVLVGGFAAGATVVVGGAVVDAALFQLHPGTLAFIDEAAVARLILFIPIGLWIAWLIAAVVEARAADASAAERFRGLVEAMPDATFVVDPATWRIEDANATALAGRSGSTVLGAPIEDLLPGARLAVGSSPTTTVLRTGDEAGVPVEVVARVVEIPHGDRRVLITAHDLTERIEAEVRLTRMAAAERAQTRMLREVIGSMDDGVALLAPDDAVIVGNERLNTLVGRPVATGAELAAALGIPLEDGDTQLPGSDRWLRLISHALGEEASGGRLLVLRDISAEVEAAATRDAFLGVLSHELRTPITTILGDAHMLRRTRADGARMERADELVVDMADSAEQLHHLVEDLLVLSRAQSGAVAFEPEPVLLQHVAREVVEAESARYPHVTFDIDTPPALPPVNGDRTFLNQVLRNLVGNAGKYSPSEPCHVVVRLTAAPSEVEVRVLDEGPGFPPDDAERLFQIFYRSERTAKRRAGSGIGLYVTRALVEAMGGRVWAVERPEVGSEFGFSIPIADADEPAAFEPTTVH